MYMGIRSDPSSSTIKMLMRDDDKSLSSWVICAALNDRRSAGRLKRATVWGMSLQMLKPEIANRRGHFTATVNIDTVLKSSLGSPPYYYLFYFFLY